MGRPIRTLGQRLWDVAIPSTREAEDAVCQLLAERFGAPPSVHVDARTQKPTVRLCVARQAYDARELRAIVGRVLRKVADAGLTVGSGRPTVTELAPRDWANAWKEHFRPLQFGNRLLVRASFHRHRARPGQRVVVLDPGLSFGTGHHPTTRFCLHQLVRHADLAQRRSFLDVGTGSGVLAIAAAKLGYGPVLAWDVDPDSIRVAAANARRNRVADKLVLRLADLRLLGRRPTVRRFDLVCANLTADLLLAEPKRLAGLVAPTGRLVLAGILRGQFADVAQAYRRLGFTVAEQRAEGDWCSGALRLSP